MDGADAITQDVLHLPAWGIDSPVIRAGHRLYFPLTVLCAVLGIDAQKQRMRISEHAVLGRLLVRLPVQTTNGRRLTYCLERRGLAFWLGSIQLASVRPTIAPRLLEFQEALVDAASRMVFGEIESALAQDVDSPRTLARFAVALEQRIGRLEERVIVPEEEGE